MREIVYLNGNYLPIDQAKVSVMDRGFLLADGIYEAVTLYNAKPFMLDKHLERFHYGLQAIHLSIHQSDEAIKEILRCLQTMNLPAPQQLFYFQATRGVTRERQHFFDEYEPTFFARLSAVKPKNSYEGVKAITVEEIRWRRCDIKGINRLANVMIAEQAHLAHAEEAIIINNGMVVEGATCNVFIVREGQIITPPLSHQMLQGVTRGIIIEESQALGGCEEREISFEELKDADEIWISSSSREILPVVQLDDDIVGTGKPGEVFNAILSRFHQRRASLKSE